MQPTGVPIRFDTFDLFSFPPSFQDCTQSKCVELQLTTVNYIVLSILNCRIFDPVPCWIRACVHERGGIPDETVWTGDRPLQTILSMWYVPYLTD